MTSVVEKYLAPASAMSVLVLYTQDFAQTFGEVFTCDLDDHAAKLRRLEYYYGRTALGWIVGGPALMTRYGYEDAFVACRDMSSETRSHLIEFIKVMQDELTPHSLMDAKELELFF